MGVRGGEGAEGLADGLEDLAEPRLTGVEGLAALDARELDRAQHIAALLVLADHAAFAAEGAVDGVIAALLIRARSAALAGAAREK